MEYAAVMPIDQYNVTLSHGTFGLHESYKHEPELLALIMIATTIPYDYELNVIEPGKTRVTINDLSMFYETLDVQIQGFSIRDLLKTLTPLEFYEAIVDEPLDDVPLTKRMYMAGNLLSMVVGARAAAWGLNHRGLLETEGKVHKVNFGGGIAVPDRLKIYHQKIVETKRNEKR